MMAAPETSTPPLAQLPAFLEALEQHGFRLAIDDYPRIHAILQRADSTARLRTLLCPLVATDSESQAEFYGLFGRFFGAEEAAPEELLILPEGGKTKIFPEGLPEKGKAARPGEKAGEQAPEETLLLRLLALVLALSIVPASYFYYLGRITNLGFAAILLALLVGLLLVYLLLRRLRGRLVARSIQAKEPPWFWAIDLPLRERIHFGEELSTLARQLRRRLPGNIPRLDIRRTLRETVGNGGAMALHYQYRTRPAEYLFLIDYTAFADHHHHLFELLHRELLKNTVYVERFYYNGDMRVCWNEKHPRGIALEKLAARYADYRLFLFGDGKKMIRPAGSGLQGWAQVFSQWSDRALLTPRPAAAWSHDELRLAEQFVLLPSNMAGLLQAIEYFEQLKSANLKSWRSGDAETEVRADAGAIRELSSSRPALAAWIAACAIYPELNWELTLYLGETVGSHFGESLLTFENITRIARISWFRNGHMPEAERIALFELLDEGLRLQLHQKIVDALEGQYQRNPLPELSQAYSEFRLQLAVHKLRSGNYPEERRDLEKTARRLIAEGVRHDFIAIQTVSSPRPLDVVVPATLRNLAYAAGQASLLKRLRQRAGRLLSALRLPASRPEAGEETKPPVPPPVPETDGDETTLLADREAPTEPTPTPPRPKVEVPDPAMVRVEGGAFQMGSEEYDDEKPVHEVRLHNFEIGQYPVTVREYLAFVKNTGRNRPEWMEEDSKYNVETGSDDYYKKIGSALTDENCPIVGISWFDAVAFCNWLSSRHGLEPAYRQAETPEPSKTKEILLDLRTGGYRLPTEAEWEYAARGGRQSKGYRYAGSDELDEVGWFWENSGDKRLSGEWNEDKIFKNNCRPHPVGRKKPNELGLYDMSGNVWEWCWDWYGNYSNEPQENPTGPNSGSFRVDRGGSWNRGAAGARCSNRLLDTPVGRVADLGFRLARTGGQ